MSAAEPPVRTRSRRRTDPPTPPAPFRARRGGPGPSSTTRRCSRRPPVARPGPTADPSTDRRLGRRPDEEPGAVPAGRGGGRHPQPGPLVRGHPRRPRRAGLRRPHRARRRLRLRRGPHGPRRRGAAARVRAPARRRRRRSPPRRTRRCTWWRARPFLLFCHDDVVLDPSAVRVLVEEAYRSNAGDPRAQVGERRRTRRSCSRSGAPIDRFGAPYTGIEPGEIDQEQHDGVRDVFYVPTAAMLVRTDLFEELGGFDPETFPGAEDLDLCWRARLVGARVLVVPDARVAHREAARRPRARATGPTSSRSPAPGVRVLLTVVLVRTACSGSCPSASSSGSSRRSATCSPVTRVGPGPPSAAGSRTCSTCVGCAGPAGVPRPIRTVHDSELRELQARAPPHGSGAVPRPSPAHRRPTPRPRRREPERGRLGVRRHAHAGRDRVPRVPRARRRRLARPHHRHGVPADRHLRSLARGRRSLFDSFGSAWRYTGLGSASAQPPALARHRRPRHRAPRCGRSRADAVRRPRAPARRVRRVPARAPHHRLRGPALAAGDRLRHQPRGPERDRARVASDRSCSSRCCRSCCCASSGSASGDDAQGSASCASRVLAALLGACYPARARTLRARRVAAHARHRVGADRGQRHASTLRAFGCDRSRQSLLAVVLLFPWPFAYVGGSGDAAALGFAFRPDLDLVADPALRHRPGQRGVGDVGPGGRRRGPAVRRHRASASRGPRGVGCSRSSAGPRCGCRRPVLPARVGARARGRAHRSPRSACRCALGIAVSVFVDGIAVVQVRVAPARGDPRRGRDRCCPASAFTADVFDGRWDAPDAGLDDRRSRSPGRSPPKGSSACCGSATRQVLPLDPVVLHDGTGLHAHPQRSG